MTWFNVPNTGRASPGHLIRAHLLWLPVGVNHLAEKTLLGLLTHSEPIVKSCTARTIFYVSAAIFIKASFFIS